MKHGNSLKGIGWPFLSTIVWVVQVLSNRLFPVRNLWTVVDEGSWAHLTIRLCYRENRKQCEVQYTPTDSRLSQQSLFSHELSATMFRLPFLLLIVVILWDHAFAVCVEKASSNKCAGAKMTINWRDIGSPTERPPHFSFQLHHPMGNHVDSFLFDRICNIICK